MALDPQTPILIGVGTAQRRCDDPGDALEAIELMIEAVQSAENDAGSVGLLKRADRIAVPRGFWAYSDPARLIGERINAPHAKTLLAEIGVLQQSLISDACRAIAAGEARVAIVAGGEAKYRSLRAQILGSELSETAQTEVAPDEVWRPKESLWADIEWERGLHMPVGYYAIMENALRYHDDMEVSAHRDELARMYAGFSRIAENNPSAWNRKGVSAETIRNASEKNPMIAFPYTKLHNTSWNVDQAAALVFCSLETAQQVGIARDRWVFPLSGTESNFMLDMSARDCLHRSKGAEIAGKRALSLAGRSAEEMAYAELYSCFPSAVRIFAEELGLSLDRPLTVTGGMPFAGGPLNNFILQATARMAEVLRDDPGTTGIVSSVSGMLTKQGFGVWCTEPNQRGFGYADVTPDVAQQSARREIVGEYTGEAEVAAYTVLYSGGAFMRAVAICDLPSGARTVAYCDDSGIESALTESEFCGHAVRIDEKGRFS